MRFTDSLVRSHMRRRLFFLFGLWTVFEKQNKPGGGELVLSFTLTAGYRLTNFVNESFSAQTWSGTTAWSNKSQADVLLRAKHNEYIWMLRVFKYKSTLNQKHLEKQLFVQLCVSLFSYWLFWGFTSSETPVGAAVTWEVTTVVTVIMRVLTPGGMAIVVKCCDFKVRQC